MKYLLPNTKIMVYQIHYLRILNTLFFATIGVQIIVACILKDKISSCGLCSLSLFGWIISLAVLSVLTTIYDLCYRQYKSLNKLYYKALLYFITIGYLVWLLIGLCLYFESCDGQSNPLETSLICLLITVNLLKILHIFIFPHKYVDAEITNPLIQTVDNSSSVISISQQIPIQPSYQQSSYQQSFYQQSSYQQPSYQPSSYQPSLINNSLEHRSPYIPIHYNITEPSFDDPPKYEEIRAHDMSLREDIIEPNYDYDDVVLQCPDCKGEGNVFYWLNIPYPIASEAIVCVKCNGTGHTQWQ